ncbi:hypothetical protein C0992_010472 [Termitomyces sp. T32_za158]|nr:hypothetical protein C0992_010472 [Termitomyces sp. T32_za158]
MALREALKLGLTWDPDIRLRMESANQQVNESVGLARNVPFTFAEGFTIYLQVHIFEQPAYTVLLGRPFDTLTESTIQNLQDGSAIITIRDPNTGRRTALPTIERGKMPKGGVAVSLAETQEGEIVVTGYSMEYSKFSKDDLRDVYLQAFTASKGGEGKDQKTLAAYLNGKLPQIPDTLEKILVQQEETLRSEAGGGETAQVFSKKYKPVARKVKPVLGTSPEEFRIERHITGDPLADMPKLDPRPPDFEPTGRGDESSTSFDDAAE